MKSRILFFLVSIFFISACKDKPIKIQEYNDGVLYKEFTINQDSLFHGQMLTYYEDGKSIFENATYVNGLLHGKRTLYYLNGQPEIIENYNSNVLNDTLFVYYESGRIKQKIPYFEGVLNGVLLGYYENGTLKEKVTYRDNLENGAFVEYHPNGHLNWKGNFLNGDNEFGELLKYDSSGTLIRKLNCDSLAICTTIWTIETDELQ